MRNIKNVERKKREQITIFTDGSCYSKHPEKLGGIGAYIQWNGKEFSISKGYKKTTISRMELRAILYALKSVAKDTVCTVTLYSDSQYAVNIIKNKGFDWKNNDLKDCENIDLLNRVFQVIEERKKMRLKLIWIPGHRERIDDPIVRGNRIADMLADYKSHKTYHRDIIK